MKKGFLVIAYLLIGMTVALANHKLSNKETESPLIACLEDKDNKDREIDTIATTLDEWFPLLKEKAKEGWKFQRLIYQEGKDVLLVIDRPIPNPQNKSSVSERNVDSKYYDPELFPNQPNYIEDGYYESPGLGVMHIVNDKVVEWIRE